MLVDVVVVVVVIVKLSLSKTSTSFIGKFGNCSVVVVDVVVGFVVVVLEGV